VNKIPTDHLQPAQVAIRCAIGAAAATAIAQVLKLDFPVFAMLAAVISTDLTPLQGRLLGLRRLFATVIGAVAGMLFSAILPPTAWSAGIGILCTMFVTQQLNVRSGAKVAAYICAVIVLHYGSASGYYAFYRFTETALGISIAWLFVFVPLLFTNEAVEARRREERELSSPWFRIDDEPTAPRWHLLTLDVQLSLRTAVAATLAMLISQLLEFDYPIFAGIAAVITTDLSPARSRALGTRRLVTTIIGAGCGGLMSTVVGADPWWVGAGILITMLACQLAGLAEAAKIAACVCGIVMIMHGGHPLAFALERMIETGIGVVVAFAVSYVPKLIKLEDPQSPEAASDVS